MEELLVYYFKEGSRFVWLNNIFKALNIILVPALIISVALCGVFIIYFSFNMAKAETQEKKDRAKKVIVNIVIGLAVFVVLVVLAILFVNFAPAILGENSELLTQNWYETPQGKGKEPPQEAMIGLLNYAKVMF